MLFWSRKLLMVMCALIRANTTENLSTSATFTAVFSERTPISCNESEKVISIKNVSLSKQPMKCDYGPGIQAISTDTINFVKQQCDNKTSCNIDRMMIPDKERVFHNLGFYNLYSSCLDHNEIVQECTFESWCMCRNYTDGGFKWRRRSGSKYNLPSSDHTYSSPGSKGRFAYIYSNKTNQINATATLTLVIQNVALTNKCLTFWLFKTNTDHSLKVFEMPNQTPIDTLTKLYNKWTIQTMDLKASSKHSIMFKVSAQNKPFEGTIALDDLKILNHSCDEMEKRKQCVPLEPDTVIKTCANGLNITFDPTINECTPVYTKIQEQFFNQCSSNTSVTSCELNLSEVLNNKRDCFWRNEIQLHFTCTNKTEISSESDVAIFEIEEIGLVVAVVVLVFCVVGAVIFLVVRRRRSDKSTMGIIKQPTNYTGQQDISLPKPSSNTRPMYGNKNDLHQTHRDVRQSDYECVESEQELIPSRQDNDLMSVSYRDHLVTLKTGEEPEEVYFVLEKTTENYQMAQPFVDFESPYDFTDSQYAISGNNYHRQDKTNNVYSQSVDQTYDSSFHARKDDVDHDQFYQHTQQKTEGDYDLCR